MYTAPVTLSPVIWTLRMKVGATVTAALQVAPLSVEQHDLDRTAADSEVVPGNVHSSEERRRRIVIGPARLAVVGGAVVNTEMGPAIRVRRE